MPKLNRNALFAQMVRHAGPGSYVDGNGLMLRVRDSGSRSWVQRIMVHGRRVDIGLGNAELVSLANARRMAADNRAVARTGGDPRRARTISFAEAEPGAMAERAETWRRGTASKSQRDWRSTMDAYVLAQLGKMPVEAVATSDVKRVMRPLALAGKHATMRMVAGRIVAVLEWAEVEDLREPAGSGRAIVETVTRSLPKAAAVRHHRALHFADVAEALGRVDAHPRIARTVQLAIRFGVLTAARQAEVRRATWDEFDLEEAVWTVPEAHMKRYRPHRVPLSTGALAVLHGVAEPERPRRVRLLRRAGREAQQDGGGRRPEKGGDQRHGPRVPVQLQGLGSPRGRGRTALGVRAGPCRGLEDGGRLRARRPAREAASRDAGVVQFSRCSCRVTDAAAPGGSRARLILAATDLSNY